MRISFNATNNNKIRPLVNSELGKSTVDTPDKFKNPRTKNIAKLHGKVKKPMNKAAN